MYIYRRDVGERGTRVFLGDDSVEEDDSAHEGVDDGELVVGDRVQGERADAPGEGLQVLRARGQS